MTDLRIGDEARTLSFSFDGVTHHARPGESVAAALWADGVRAFRMSPAGDPRAPLCFMGLCQECLVAIDGRRVESCRTTVTGGMTVTRIDG